MPGVEGFRSFVMHKVRLNLVKLLLTLGQNFRRAEAPNCQRYRSGECELAASKQNQGSGEATWHWHRHTIPNKYSPNPPERDVRLQ